MMTMSDGTNPRRPSTTEKIETMISLFSDQFMKPEILTRLTVSEITNDFGECRWTKQGDENLEEGEQITATYENVSLCRLSASGFSDCTDWELCHDENDILEWIEREAEQITGEL